jgi:hypothetical protein
VLFRFWIGDQEQYLNNPDKRQAAWDYLNRFLPALAANEQWIDYVESLNEVIGKHDIPGIQNAVAFDVAFAQALAKSGVNVAPALLTAAVGNPDHGAETEMLIPAVEAAIFHGGVLAPHGYWPQDGPLVNWREHIGRPLDSWDAIFGHHGLDPRYILGECGVIYSPDGGLSFDPTGQRGWRHPDCLNSDWLAYLTHLDQLNQKVNLWNADHGGRCLGVTLFTSGVGVGWEWFQLGASEFADLAQL